MSGQYGFAKENIPESYQRITWQDRLERIPSDYGVPDHPYMTREYYQQLTEEYGKGEVWEIHPEYEGPY